MFRITLTLLATLSSPTLAQTMQPLLLGTSPGRQIVQDVSGQLPRLIMEAQQVVLYAPVLMRADVAEAVRRALTEHGTRVTLITTREPLFTDDSFTFRLLLMRVPTYLTNGAGVPFAFIDGRAISGPGIADSGVATLTSPQDSARLRTWITQVMRATKPVNPVQAVREWVQRSGGPTLK